MLDKEDDTGNGGTSTIPGSFLVNSFPRSTPTLAEEAFHGLAGDIVRTIEPHSEADPAALLLHFLVFYGNAVGNGPYIELGSDNQPSRLFAVVVGDAALGRKGTAGSEIERLMRDADRKWYNRALTSGLQSSEAIVTAVDDEMGQSKDLLIYYSEFGGLLSAMNRRDNISDTLKLAYDGKTLKIRTKHHNGWRTASHAHISVMGHVTPSILADRLSSAEIASGFANRFIYFAVERSKLLSRPRPIPEETRESMADRVDESLYWVNDFVFAGVDPISADLYRHFGRKPKREMHLSDAAWDYWDELYLVLSEKRPGVVGELMGRAPANVIRLALIYALLDKSIVIDVPHLKAAKAVMDYSEESIAQVFAGITGDHQVDRVLYELSTAVNQTLSRNNILNIFNRNLSVAQVTKVIERLMETGLVTHTRGTTGPRGGRPPDLYTLTRERGNEETTLEIPEPK